MGVCTLHDVLNRVGPFKLIRGDPGRPDGWIQPDSVVDEEEDVLNLKKKEVESVHKSEELLLFHLDEDPYEKINLATKFPAVTKYLSKLLDKYEVIFLFANQNGSLGTLSKKNDIIWEFFPNVGPPPTPPFGNPLSKKNF